MCNSKAEGGQRCAVHMHGSRAAFKSAQVSTGADQKVIAVVFKQLREDGANLPNPTAEEVKEYAASQRVAALFDPDLSNRDRNTLIRNWTKAEDERPDGGVFHAWKNLSKRVKTYMRRAVAGFLVVGALAGAAACSNGSQSPGPTPTPAGGETPTSEVVEVVPANLDGGLVEGELTSDQHGQYRQLTLDPESPLLQYNPDVIHSSAIHLSKEEVLEAQKIASTFVVEEALDSELVFGWSEEAAQAWLADNGHYFSEEALPDISADVSNPEKRPTVIDTDGARATYDDEGNKLTGEWSRGNPVYDGGSARWDNLSVNLTSVFMTEQGELVFTYTATGDRPITDSVNTSDKTIYREVNEHELLYALDQGSDGWEIVGWHNSINTTATAYE